VREILGKANSVRELLKGVEYNKAELERRSQLYRQIAERIWNPADLLKDGQP
jgi:hypothetical protein